MKKAIITLIVTTFIAIPAFAQYWTSTTSYDPFRNGEKSIGLTFGTGWWFGPSEANILSSYGIFGNYTTTKVSRPPLNPSISFHYKRVLQGNTVSWGNSFLISYNSWSGKVEGAHINGDTSFTTEYKFAEIMLSDIYYIMIPVGEKISINAGAGLSIGVNRSTKSTATFSNGNSMELNGGGEISDWLIGKIIAMAGVDYALSDSFTVSGNVMAWPLDIFGSLGDHKDMRNVGEGLYVNTKLPFQLTVGFTYSL